MADRIVTIGSGKMYATPALAMVGEADFQAGEDNIVFVLDAGTYNNFTFRSFTSSATHRVIVQCASDAFHGFVRSQGVVIRVTANWAQQSAPYVTWIGISFTQDPTYTAAWGGLVVGSPYVIIIGCMAYDLSGDGYYYSGSYHGAEGIFITDNGSPLDTRIINSAAFNCAGVGIGAQFGTDGGGNLCVYNCIAMDCQDGFRPAGYTAPHITNCYAARNSDENYATGDGGNEFTISNCYSDNGNKSTSIISVANCHFTNSASENQEITFDSTSALRQIGLDLSADTYYPFNTDGFETIRPSGINQWDIGPYQYTESAPVEPPVITKKIFCIRK